jgi:hypothetical protein
LRKKAVLYTYPVSIGGKGFVDIFIVKKKKKKKKKKNHPWPQQVKLRVGHNTLTCRGLGCVLQ